MKVSCSNPATWLTLTNVHFSPVLGNQAFREFTSTFRNYLDEVCLFFHFPPILPFLSCSTPLGMSLFLIFIVGLSIDQAGREQTIKKSSRHVGPWGGRGWAGLILFVQVHYNAACGVNIFHFITPGSGPGPFCSPGPWLGLISVVPGLWKAAVTERKTNEVAINISARCPMRADGYTQGAGGGPAWLGSLGPPSNHLSPQGLLSAEPSSSNWNWLWFNVGLNRHPQVLGHCVCSL